MWEEKDKTGGNQVSPFSTIFFTLWKLMKKNLLILQFKEFGERQDWWEQHAHIFFK